MSQPKSLIRAADVTEIPGFTFRHPLNPRSEIVIQSLSAAAGLQRIGLHLGRLAPGKDSFIYHFHHFEEEFVYILSGRGVAEIGEETFEVGPGDCMLFTAPSEGHNLSNPFAEELVYLMGGENRPVEIGEFPRQHKRAVFEKGSMAYIVDADAVEPFMPRIV